MAVMIDVSTIGGVFGLPYRVILTSEPNQDELLAWISDSSIPGEFAWDDGHIEVVNNQPRWSLGNDADWALIVGFSDPDAAFAFKMRWA